VSGEATVLGVMLMLGRATARMRQNSPAPPDAGAPSPGQEPPKPVFSRRRGLEPAWSENAPLFVRRRRAWLHAVLSGAEPTPQRDL